MGIVEVQSSPLKMRSFVLSKKKLSYKQADLISRLLKVLGSHDWDQEKIDL